MMFAILNSHSPVHGANHNLHASLIIYTCYDLTVDRQVLISWMWLSSMVQWSSTCLNNQWTTSSSKKAGVGYAEWPIVQYAFQPIPGLISCTGVTRKWGLHVLRPDTRQHILSHAWFWDLDFPGNHGRLYSCWSGPPRCRNRRGDQHYFLLQFRRWVNK